MSTIPTHGERLAAHGFVNHEHNCDLYRAEISELRAALAERGTAGEPEGYQAGNLYETQSGKLIRVVRHHGESMECSDGLYRYDRKGDRGRVTGSAHDYSYPENFVRLYRHPAPAGDEGLPVQASIDTPEFQRLAETWRGEPYGTRGFESAWSALIAYIDAHAAPQVAEQVVAGGLTDEQIDTPRFRELVKRVCSAYGMLDVFEIEVGELTAYIAHISKMGAK